MMNNYRFVISPRRTDDPRSAGYLADAHALGLTSVSRLRCHDLYFLEGAPAAGELSEADLKRMAVELLSDPVTQDYAYTCQTDQAASSSASGVVEVALRPGVTDPVAEQIVRGARELGITGVERASTGLRFEIKVEAKNQETNPREHGEEDKLGKGRNQEDTGTRSSAEEVAQVLHLLAKRLLANAVIQRYTIGEIEPVFPRAAEASAIVESLPVCDLDEAGLLALSRERRAALDLAEMQAIQGYFRREEREPSDVEIETIAQTWSEHCGHKTFKARITLTPESSEARSPSPDGREGRSEAALGGEEKINGLLRTYIRSATEEIAAPWVRSAFVDNAGIIDFDDTYEVSFKVETHNHPSAIEPFGGANTGVGGVIRDVLGVSAKPIANTDVLCFGPQDTPVDSLPEGVLHPRRIQSGVVAGVQDYGNKIGIPTVNGAILYDPGYTANPLVFCGCVGLAPKGSHPRQPQAGDRVIVLGGGTGRDGLRGATFSSMTMDAQTGEVSGASVQIGDPITEKGLIEVLLRARDQRMYHAVTDCGAGGLSSAVGEMSSTIGADVELKRVRLKYAGLAPWEIWLSEAQERMVFAVPAENVPALQAICDTFDVNLTDIGEFTGSGRLVVRYNGKPVLDLENSFLHEGIPQRQLKAEINRGERKERREEEGKEIYRRERGERGEGRDKNLDVQKTPSLSVSVVNSFNDTLLALLAHPNIASKAPVIRIYDHEVQGGTVVKPLTGAENDGPSDACVLKPIGTRGTGGIVLSNGINPEYGKLDAYHMSWSVIDEAIRNAVAVGCNPERIALLDNFCWGDPLRPETLGSLVEACRGCHDAALHYRTPFISGKDSLNNEYLGSDGQRHAIPPTLLISAMGLIEDVGQAVTMDLKEAGDLVYLVGEFQPAWGGSHYERIHASSTKGGPVPSISTAAPETYRAVHAAMQDGLVRACHDLSEGGLAVASAEMCIGGRLGMEITGNLDVLGSIAAQNIQISDIYPGGKKAPVNLVLFGETNGCLLVEVRADDQAAFERLMDGTVYCRLGSVTAEPILSIGIEDEVLIRLPVEDLVRKWQGA
jgi:phosphoribosylformylglycinamidine (FGAM) synthase-like enzyme/phosphoribosylformylglycinamidine (FGAM) synthase PurS component